MSKNKRKKIKNRVLIEKLTEMLPVMIDLRRAIEIHDREDLKKLSQLELLRGLANYNDIGSFFTYFPKLKIYLSTEAILKTENMLIGDKRIVRLGTEQALCCVTQKTAIFFSPSSLKTPRSNIRADSSPASNTTSPPILFDVRGFVVFPHIWTDLRVGAVLREQNALPWIVVLR